MKILFAGTPEVAAKTLQTLATDPRFAGFEIAGVLTREDAPLGRKRILTPSPTATTAEALGIPVIKANRIDADTLVSIGKLGVDLGIVIAYGVLLKLDALQALPLGWYNLHFSQLPKWRGAAPVQRALMAGERDTAVTLFKLDEGMDTGPIAGVVPTEIQPDETSGDLLNRLRLLGESLLAEQLPAIASGAVNLVEQSQSTLTPTLAPKLGRTDSVLDFARAATELEAIVRGANPEPMAHTNFRDQNLRVLRARAHASSASGQMNGTARLDGSRVLVTTGSGDLELLEVQPAGKNPMRASDWARGANLPALLGENL